MGQKAKAGKSVVLNYEYRPTLPPNYRAYPFQQVVFPKDFANCNQVTVSVEAASVSVKNAVLAIDNLAYTAHFVS